MYQSPAKLGDKISPYLFIQWKLVIPVMAYIFTIVIRYMFTIFHHAIATHTHIYNYGDSHFHHKITIYKYIFIMYIYIFHNFSPFIPLKLADFFPPNSARHFGQKGAGASPWAGSRERCQRQALFCGAGAVSWGVFFLWDIYPLVN